jgi:hypothetical protein
MTWRVAGVFVLFVSIPWTSFGQVGPRLKVFVDCEECFLDYLQEEIEFVDHVRDPADADVHVILTTAETSAEGTEYSADFIGQGGFSTTRRSLRTTTTADDVDDSVRRQIASMVSIGLLTFAAQEVVPSALSVSVGVDGNQAQQAIPARDPWKRWIFSVRGSGSFEGEESQRQIETSGEVSADRITPDWKVTLGGEFEHSDERFEIEDEGPVVAERREREIRGLAVKSLGEHWSGGVEGATESSTFENIKVAFESAPAVEFNLFPYSQYTRRQLRLKYGVGLRHATYYEETVYGKFEETHPVHSAEVAFERTEPWGSLDTRLEWSQYLHDLSLSRLEAEGELSWRLVRGVSFSVEGRASRIRDQISLPRRGATEEEVLLEVRELRSGYEYGVSFGVTYTFGSIFSAIVNPRFGR